MNKRAQSFPSLNYVRKLFDRGYAVLQVNKHLYIPYNVISI